MTFLEKISEPDFLLQVVFIIVTLVSFYYKIQITMKLLDSRVKQLEYYTREGLKKRAIRDKAHNDKEHKELLLEIKNMNTKLDKLIVEFEIKVKEAAKN